MLNTPAAPERSCAIANVHVEGVAPADLAKTLLDKYRIFTVAIDGAGVRGVRVTPHVLTTTAELDALVKALVELKLEVWDSPNSAGVVIDAVRIIKLALNNGVAGQLDGPSSYLMKSPHTQRPDDEAREQTEEFIAKYARVKSPVAGAAKSPTS